MEAVRAGYLDQSDRRLTSRSRLSHALLSCKEAPVGRPTVDPPCLSSLHRPLKRRRQQTEPPEPPSKYPSRVAASREEQQSEARARCREGPTYGFQRGPHHDHDLQRPQVKDRTSPILRCSLCWALYHSVMRLDIKRWQRLSKANRQRQLTHTRRLTLLHGALQLLSLLCV